MASTFLYVPLCFFFFFCCLCRNRRSRSASRSFCSVCFCSALPVPAGAGGPSAPLWKSRAFGVRAGSPPHPLRVPFFLARAIIRDSGAEPELPPVFQHKGVDLPVPGFRAKGDLAGFQAGAVRPLDDAHPEGIFKKDGQRTQIFLHGKHSSLYGEEWTTEEEGY